jgi:hypothetical protein
VALHNIDSKYVGLYPGFVSTHDVTSSFGFEWNKHRSWLMKNPILDRAARPESGQDAARKVPDRLAFAGDSASQIVGIDQLDEPRHAAGRGSQAQMAEDFDNHRRIFNGRDDLQRAAAVGAVFDVDVEEPF